LYQTQEEIIMKKEAILSAVNDLTRNYREEELFLPRSSRNLPSRSAVIDIIRELKPVLFPGYFGMDTSASLFPEHYVGYRLNDLYDRLKEQIEIALFYQGGEAQQARERAEEVTGNFIKKLPEIQEMLLKDVQAGFDGDPAAKSKEEIVFSYPGFYAIYIFRIAHVLYTEQVPFIPRIMTEYAHGNTGIDINPGATIGEYFFIDHGTGVVIGETTEIGNNVKLYQGVTLGALSTRMGQQLANVKRHPTIRDNVTIYSNSTVLGGETVIGENTIIGGNTFITESIPANTKVSAKSPELVIKKPRTQVTASNVWDWEN
jgi:serine O-acetyltransferase